MRLTPTYRRHSAIALVFAAWCAAYGLPAELARNLTAQTVGLTHLNGVRPAQKAKVLLDRFSHQVRTEQARAHQPFFEPFLDEAVAPVPALACSQQFDLSVSVQQPVGAAGTALFQRPPPASFRS